MANHSQWVLDNKDTSLVFGNSMINLRLLETNAQIESKINRAISEHLNKQLNKKEKTLLRRLKVAVETWVRSSPEIQSIQNRDPNELGAEFGIRKSKAEPAVEAIVEAIVNSTEISANRFSRKLRGGVDFYFQPSNFTNLLQLPQGHVLTKKGSDLHWLDWLLTRGDSTIVFGYEYVPSRDGRSGGGTMEKGDSFRVNPKYSGTVDDNFVTRLLSGREDEISKIITEMFTQ